MKNRLISIMLVSFLVFGGFVGFVSIESKNAQGTSVIGIVYDGSGGPWTPAGSPYIVIGDVTVPAGETLTIEPGAQVKFDGNYSLYVHGTLTALGTETNRINITSNLPRIPPLYYWESIQINSTGHADIKYCDISYSSWGIKLVGSSNNIVANNTISLGRTHCVTLDFSSNNIIANNILSDTHGSGIDFYFSSNNTISGNYVINNSGHGINLQDSSNNNTISGNHINSNLGGTIYLVNSSNNNTITHNYISGNLFGLVLWSSYNNVVTNNNISNNVNGVQWDGIVLYFSSNNTVTNNNISNNDDGIYLDTSLTNLITGNNVSSNNIHGVYLIDSNGNTINGNNISNNREGFNLTSSSNNRIYHNNIIDNVNQAYDNMDNNFWNDTYPSGGNYWSDWSPITPDLYSGPITPQTTGSPDGICDFQYDIDSDSVDYYPLKNLVDTKPPTITNLQPPDTSTTKDNTTTISADYSDPSGINTSSVMLIVDGINVTSSATVTASGVSYIPSIALSEGLHTVYLEVSDTFGNIATVTWTFTVVTALPPITNLTIKVVNNGNYIELEWEPPSSLALDHYLIYRSDSATEFDFTTPHNISTTWPNPKNFTWVDPDPNVTQVNDDFYYIIRAANFDESDVSTTSNTAGVWTKTFQPGISTFSLPLEPFVKMDTEFYCQNMNASYIKWMNLTSHTWMRHDKGDSQNNSLIEVGKGYEIGFLGKSIQTRYTFTGLPGAMIIYDDDTGFSGFDPVTEAKNLSVSVEPNGDVTLTWPEPASMGFGDWYEVYYSNERDGFFGTFGNEYDLACSLGFENSIITISGLGANNPGVRLYFMVVPFNSLGIRGASTYSIGIWTEEYLAQYDTFGIPLKLNTYQTADWYCDNIPDTVGMNYFNINGQRWNWHSTRMPEGAFDSVLEMAEGYQISTSGSTKFTFIGR